MTDPVDERVDERMDDRMDQRLAAAARRWQAEQLPPPGVPLERLEAPTNKRVPWRALVAVAAAVLVVGAGASVVSHLDRSDTDPAQGPSTSSPTAVRQPHADVPWRDLKAGHPDIRHTAGGEVVTPYDLVLASGHISGDAHPGDVLVFTAALESDTQLALSPCPDYDIAFGRFAFYQYRLNCAQVPYRDRKGRPVLPAHRKVRFEMRVRVPDVAGQQKVLWTLDGPQSAPGFYGLVTVTPR
jgi:hypothetical protein